jgi:hypothetical protein
MSVLSTNSLFNFKRGAIGIWNRNLNIEKSFRIDQEDFEKALRANKNIRKKPCTWVTDAIILQNNHKLVISTSGREIKVFTMSLEHFIEDFSISGMIFSVTKDAYTDTEFHLQSVKQNGKPELYIIQNI